MLVAADRIVCLAAEMPGILDALGALDRVVGISAYTTEPAAALALPKVSGFRSGNIRRILELEPDLAILTSGVQKDLGVRLAEQGVTLLHVNPHRLKDVYQTIALLGNLTNTSARAKVVMETLQHDFDEIAREGRSLAWHPRVYFEEWMDPLICGTGWVSDIITLAGGTDVFRARSIQGRAARDRYVTAEDVVESRPDIILASWCGKPLQEDVVFNRFQFRGVPAVEDKAVIEVGGGILQCGLSLLPAARRVHEILRSVVDSHPLEAEEP